MTAARTASWPVRPAERAFELRPRPPFRLDLTVWALRRGEHNAIDGWDGSHYRRLLVASDASFEMSVTQSGFADRPRLEVVLSGPWVGPVAESAARRTLNVLLGLDVDLSGFYARAAGDQTLSELADRYRGLKPPRFPTLFECLLNAVACQQLSLAAGLSLLSQLATTAGRSTGALHAFPTPAHVLGLPRASLRTIGFSERKAETILDLATAAAAGELELDALEHLDDATVVETLMRRRGIGRWSADYVLLRGLGRLHVFPHKDIGALNGLGRFLTEVEVNDDPSAALARWTPDAGMVYLHLLVRGLEQRGVLDPDSGMAVQ
jgi:DNA-3-methyladenine glycosylase II